MILSVLIPTLEERAAPFQHIFDKLDAQIRRAEADRDVEVLFDRDNRERCVGSKRNSLVRRAQGQFVAFVDDDDDVSDRYIATICEIIRRRPDIDCIGIKGIITFRGSHPREFTHSLQYEVYSSRRHNYFRPPYHLNPILRSIAVKYPFREVNYSEDIEWCLRLQRARALTCEEFVDQPLYFYKSRRWWIYQLLLDWSEPVRHALGLRLTNRLLLSR